MQAKKSFGQHFLKDTDLAESIANSLRLAGQTGCVLEVGPGMGMLTQYLLQHPEFELFAIEADRDMVEYLSKTYPELAEKRLIPKDFLDFNAPEYFGERPFCLIGNYPYNISTQILFKLLEWRSQIPEMVGMFQKEVADRIVSPPGSRVYGITSVLAQAYFDTEYLFTVPPSAFTPPPKVQSAVIRLTRKENFTLNCDERLFRTIVKTAFGQRRKMLRNTLKPFLAGDVLMSNPYFEKRPEALHWEEYVQLTNDVAAQKKEES